MTEFIKNAEFITGNPEWGKICPKFKKAFILSDELERAELQISALGIYVAEINGIKVGDRVLTPGWTAYENRLQYQSYDVTSLLSSRNVIEIGCGHGWFASRMGTPKTVNGFYGDVPALICALKLDYADGKTEMIYSDDSWAVAKSEYIQSQIYDGETMDARIVPEFTEKARVFDWDKNTLIPDEGEPIRETERISVREVIYAPNGSVILDFGQNLTGYLEFAVEGKSGDEITVRHAEILAPDGNIYTENYRSAKALIKYTLKEGKQTYKAKYTFYGFRYVEITGITSIEPDNFSAIVVHSDMKRSAWFECGAAKVNKLYENIIWGQRGNFVDVPTDCPQRDERLGWTGDAEVFCRTACINFDAEKFFAKWMNDMRAEQREGAIPRVIPNILEHDKNVNTHCSAAWGDAATVCPWENYVAYGNKKLLSKNYPMMCDYIEYLHSRPGEEFLWQNGRHFGDWLGLDAPAGSYKGSTSDELIATAYFYLSTGLTVKAGRVLGLDVSKYEAWLPKIKEAFGKAYFVGGDRLITDTQTSYVLALHFGLVDKGTERYAAFAKRLIELIEAAGDCLQTGFVGTPYLLDTLTEIGRVDKAYTLLLQEKFPSWLFSVNMGATTIWEHWDGLKADGSVWSADMNSFNHYAYGSVAAWMYRTVCGITPDEASPAYTHIFLRPIADARLGHAKATLETRSGKVSSSWVFDGKAFRYTFEIPNGMTATLELNGKICELSAGRHTYFG